MGQEVIVAEDWCNISPKIIGHAKVPRVSYLGEHVWWKPS